MLLYNLKATRSGTALDFGSVLALPQAGTGSKFELGKAHGPRDDASIRQQVGKQMVACYDYVRTIFSEGSKPMILKEAAFSIGVIKVQPRAVNPALFLPVVNMFAGGNLALEGEPGTGKTTVVDFLAQACFKLGRDHTRRARIQGNPNATEEKLNASLNLAKLVKDGIELVKASFFSLSFLKIFDEDNRFPSEILSLLYSMLAEGFVSYRGVEIKGPKGPSFAARNFADSGNFDLGAAYRDRWDAVVAAMGINPAELNRLLIDGNGDIQAKLKTLGEAALIDDMGTKYSEFLEASAIELVNDQTLKSEIESEKNVYRTANGLDIPVEKRNQLIERLVEKYAKDTIGMDVLRIASLVKLNEWIETESQYRKMQAAMQRMPWSKEAKRLLVEFAGQTKYCFGIAPDNLQEQVREFFPNPDSIYDLCEKCPINSDKLVCKRIKFNDGKGLGTRWLQSAILYAPYVSAYLGHAEIGVEELMQVMAAVLHDRAGYHEDNMKKAGASDADMLSFKRRRENAMLAMLKDAHALTKEAKVIELYDELFAIEDQYRHMTQDLAHIKALSKRIAKLLGSMFKKERANFKPLILKSASSTAAASYLENMLTDLLKQIDDDERTLLVAELSKP